MGKQDVYKQAHPLLYNANLDVRSMVKYVGSIEEARLTLSTMKHMGWKWVRYRRGDHWFRFVHTETNMPYVYPLGTKWRLTEEGQRGTFPFGVDFDSPIACAAAALLFQREAMWVDCSD